MLWRLRLICVGVGVGVGRFDGINGDYWQREQFAGARDGVGALTAGEQAIGADAMEASSPFHLKVTPFSLHASKRRFEIATRWV